jgi:serine/threonine protein kinase
MANNLTVGDKPNAWPSVVGNYEILSLLGQGGMGAVFRARHQNLGRIVAVKLLPLTSLSKPAAVARFYREMSAVGRIDHENVVRAIDAGESDGFHYLVMEYVEGADLKRVIEVVGLPPPAVAAEIIRQAAMGLVGIQTAGMIHRDIKPANLFLASDGTVKLLDLGLAKFVLTLDEDQLTSTDVALGTPDYIAPEQAANSRGVDIRTDIYSLGCTLYFLLCGNAPYGLPEFDSWPKKLLAHCNEPVPPMPNENDVLPGLREITERCLEKNAEDRFQTPEELVRALEPFCELNCTLLLANQYESAPKRSQDHSEAIIDTKPISPELSTTELRVDQAASEKFRKVAWLLIAFALLLSLGIFTAAIFMFSGPSLQPLTLRGNFQPVKLAELPQPVPLSKDGEFDLPLLPSAARPTDLVASQDVYDDVATHKLYNVLSHAPYRGIQIDPTGVASWEYNTDLRQLTVNAGGTSLLQLGTTANENYELDVSLFESNWSSGSGIFFGLQRASEGEWKFQFIRFSTTKMDKSGFGAQVRRGSGTITAIGEDAYSAKLLEESSATLVHPLSGTQRITVAVRDGAFRPVVVGTEELQSLTSSNAQHKAKDYFGAFGTFNYGSQSVFQDFQFVRLSQSK